MIQPPDRHRSGALPTVNQYVLKLFIAGQSSRSERAVANLRRICQEQLAGRCEMTVIDVLERPQVAEDEKILATPTLVRQEPPPARRVIGDLSDLGQVLRGLDLPLESDGDGEPRGVAR